MTSATHLDHAAYTERLEAMPPRMRRVAELLCLGRSTADIADEMGTSVWTVKKQLRLCMEFWKLRRGGRASLCAFLIFGPRNDASVT